jgi:hypothetical protein
LAILSPPEWIGDESGITILQTVLPTSADLRTLVASLRGSWIGPLRWYGLSESADGLRLSWALEDESLRFEVHAHAGQLTIIAHGATSGRLDEATRLGHLLFRQIAGEVSRGPYGALVA